MADHRLNAIGVPVEHPVNAGFELAGRPRWWTVPGDPPDDPPMELVLVDFRDEGLPLVWVVLPVGAYRFPAMVAPALKLGNVALARLREQGAQLIPWDCEHGQALAQHLRVTA